jgi:hypothetical protein
MTFLVQRISTDGVSTQGCLYIDGSFECYTLEPPSATATVKPRAIAAGTYDLTIRWSPRFSRLLPHVENVPDFTEIMIHPGNYPENTEGCLLVGTMQGKDFVGHSVEEFDLLFQKIQDAVATGPQHISYVDIGY